MGKQREIMCAYGNCHETMVAGKGFKLTVTESSNGTVGDRQSFCCYEHAWRWLKACDDRINGARELRERRAAEIA